ncbi:MAG TPA: phosphatidylserine/phosphatidylglycerophosphate/cardiolipin synthase family protein [Allosphingosinicella sp.]|nr:phosphatidylserine/phosphatidylglycerophosphate/cardiolipin synthase family protein [Allosphingosinicella sp.]
MPETATIAERMADASAREGTPSISAEVDGNRLTLLPDGPDRFAELIALIEGARHSLRVLYYMFLDDASGRRVRDALLAAVGRGVKVSLLVDGFGSDGASEAFFQPLVDSDISFCRFEPRLGRRYLLRNHQKLALADEKVVLVGGFNIGDEYFGTVEEGAWRDLGLKVEGPDVACLAEYFDSLSAWANDGHARIRALRRMLNKHSICNGRLHWLFGGPTRRLSPWARSVKRDMLRATRLDMIAAYFSPSRTMLRRIYGVAARGCARIVTAAKSDNNTTIGAARHTYWRLLKRGVEIYEYQPTKLHTKLIVIDDVVHIGSANFDMRSLYLNLEMMLRVDDPGFAAEMRRFVDHEIADSLRIGREEHRRQRTWFNRLRWGLAHFLVVTLDYNVSRRLNFGLDGR